MFGRNTTVIVVILFLGVVAAALVMGRYAPTPTPVVAAPEKVVAEVPPPAPPEPAPEPVAETPPSPPSALVTPPTGRESEEATLQLDRLAGTLKVFSAAFKALPGKDVRLPLDYTCYRSNKTPPVNWTGAPPETKTYVLVLERRLSEDKPFWTWILFNLPGGANALPEGLPALESYPSGIAHGRNDHGSAAYVGPCEPRGKINYALRLFALDTALTTPAGVSRNDLIRAMNGHIIDAAELPILHYLRF